MAGWAFSVRIRSLFRPFPHQPRKLLRQRVVDFLEDFARGRESIGEGLAHADRLAALSGKKECASHWAARQIKGALQVKRAAISRLTKDNSTYPHLSDYGIAAIVHTNDECWPSGNVVANWPASVANRRLCILECRMSHRDLDGHHDLWALLH